MCSPDKKHKRRLICTDTVKSFNIMILGSTREQSPCASQGLMVPAAGRCSKTLPPLISVAIIPLEHLFSLKANSNIPAKYPDYPPLFNLITKRPGVRGAGAGYRTGSAVNLAVYP